jgi:cellulose synthase/poly-beta-1,6-N-acetylglucosamine synthase-like glycosyltransferase
VSVLEAALLAAALLVLVPVCVLAAQVFAALLPARERPREPVERPRVAVLVPAHDEASGIARTVRGLRAGLRQGDRLLVVADNCRDDTALLAREAGAEVAERRDERMRGKGHALDHGVRALEHDPPEVLVIVDADCEVEPGAIDRIARRCVATGRPIQADYRMQARPGAGRAERMAAFAWRVRNHVRPLGGLRLGMPCQLMGTGMALPWERARAASLATGHITEDTLLGLRLARAGAPPLYCADAVVSSVFPESAEGAASQRRRWEHGNLALALAEAPRLLAHGVARLDATLVGMALDLLVPPVALLALVLGVLLTAGAALAHASGASAPLGVAAGAAAMLAVTVVAAWVAFGRRLVSLAELAGAPLYALRKLPIYLGFFTRRQVEWVRTRRGE